jgi:hypothetical protein
VPYIFPHQNFRNAYTCAAGYRASSSQPFTWLEGPEKGAMFPASVSSNPFSNYVGSSSGLFLVLALQFDYVSPFPVQTMASTTASSGSFSYLIEYERCMSTTCSLPLNNPS